MRHPFVHATLAAFISLTLPGGCDVQGEGQILNAANGNNDCANGYTCTSPDVLPPGINGARCCPGDRSLATSPACGASQAGPEAGTAAPVGDAASGEASADATGFDANADGSDGAPSGEAGFPSETGAPVDDGAPAANDGSSPDTGDDAGDATVGG